MTNALDKKTSTEDTECTEFWALASVNSVDSVAAFFVAAMPSALPLKSEPSALVFHFQLV
jgi:hypothetical protein